MFFPRVVIVAAIFFSCFYAFGQKQKKNDHKLKLTEISEFREIRSPVLSLDLSKIWGTDTTIDSILWSIPLEKNTTVLSNSRNGQSIQGADKEKGILCIDLPNGLFVLQEYLGDSVRISLSKKYNPFLDNEIELVYLTDSLMNWKVDNVPEGAIPKTSVNFPFCVNNKVAYEQVDVYLIPLKDPIVTWDDTRLNSIPTLSIKLATNKMAVFLGAEIYVVQLKYKQPGLPLSVEIKENGEFHRDKIVRGLRYKHSYQLQDTVSIEGKSYLLDSVDTGVKNLYLHPIEETDIPYIPNVYMSKLLPYFSEQKDYLVLDFWGTWCAPCIEALPHLQDLYKFSKEKYNFLSICYDQPQNFDKAKDIFSEHGVAWPQLLDSQQDAKRNMSRGLNISFFPTYMIINRKGEILYNNFGSEGFEGLKEEIIREIGNNRTKTTENLNIF